MGLICSSHLIQSVSVTLFLGSETIFKPQNPYFKETQDSFNGPSIHQLSIKIKLIKLSIEVDCIMLLIGKLLMDRYISKFDPGHQIVCMA